MTENTEQKTFLIGDRVKILDGDKKYVGKEGQITNIHGSIYPFHYSVLLDGHGQDDWYVWCGDEIEKI